MQEETNKADDKTLIGDPTLTVRTVYLDETDRLAAYDLGARLYDLLTRPADDALAFGAGVPVFPAVAAHRVVVHADSTDILVPVLGMTAFQTRRNEVIRQINDWHAALVPGRVLPVFVSRNWLGAGNAFEGMTLLTEFDNSELATVDEIVLAIARCLQTGRSKPEMFISYARTDLEATGQVAKHIYEHVSTTTTGQAFYDHPCLLPGDSVSDQIERAIGGGVFVMVHSDSYSSRDWCQRELLTAKRERLPTLAVDVLKRGDPRTCAYGGNGPSLVWNNDPAEVHTRAMVEWVRAQYFRREAKRVAAAAQLPPPKIMTRAPELLDLAVGSLATDHDEIVMYPDPQLPAVERDVLLLGSRKLHLATPSTAYSFLGSQRSGADAPLEGMQVSLSLSNSLDVDKQQARTSGEANEDGVTRHHLDDAVVYLARCLLAAGAAIAHGGDFRTGGYLELLSELIRTYNKTARQERDFLHSYLAAILEPEDLEVTVHHMRDEEMRDKTLLSPPEPDYKRGLRDAFYFSDMRQVMSQCVDACVVIGGQAQPGLPETGPGYGGRYPGVVEEAWRMFDAGKPVYVCGGFGGAAALVADVLEGNGVPDELDDDKWLRYRSYRDRAQALDTSEFRTALALPQTQAALARLLHEAVSPFLKDEDKVLEWNGLTLTENRTLFRTRDPVTVAALVFKGLLAMNRKRVGGKLEIELVHDSITHARDLDAISVPVSENVPIGGAAGALDRALGGLVSLSEQADQSLVQIKSDDVAAGWLHLADLGASLSPDTLRQQVRSAAQETADTARRFGFRRLGIVQFGGAVVPDIPALVEPMLEGLACLAGRTTLVWFERDTERFEALKKAFEARAKDVHLTTRLPAVEAPSEPQTETMVLQVRLENDQLETIVLPPTGTAVAGHHVQPMPNESLKKFSDGVGNQRRSTPSMKELKRRGTELARVLFGEHASEVLSQCPAARVVVVHDVAASKLPFEMLAGDSVVPVAAKVGMSRRLVVPGARARQLFAKPPKAGALEVLLVINPLGDLDGAKDEGKAVAGVLRKLEKQGHVKAHVLSGKKEATREAVGEALARVDVLHYCGHAFFDGPGDDQSGLVLADGDLTLADLVGLPGLPRFAFVNACEGGRVRMKAGGTEAAGFAEFFLRSGVESYLGTFWRLGDAAATEFAERVYQELALAAPLCEAVRKARALLLDGGWKDWANYILYGEGQFRLVSGD